MDKTNLDPLPGSDDKEFWMDADVRTNLTPQVMFEGNHYFERRSGHEAECSHCHWGFALDPGDKIKEGHLYSKDGKLVI